MPHTREDVIGRAYGRLTVLAEAERQSGHRQMQCRCECGETSIVHLSHLKRSRVRSCGCLSRDVVIQRNTTHGGKHTADYNRWLQMKGRCLNPRDAAWKHYGGRGITVSDAWRTDFAAFLRDMGPCPPGHSLDRIDNDGPYTGPCEAYPHGNCRYVTRPVQGRNTRATRWITYNGVTLCLLDWATKIGIAKATLNYRLKHWSLDRALTASAQR